MYPLHEIRDAMHLQHAEGYNPKSTSAKDLNHSRDSLPEKGPLPSSTFDPDSVEVESS